MLRHDFRLARTRAGNELQIAAVMQNGVILLRSKLHDMPLVGRAAFTRVLWQAAEHEQAKCKAQGPILRPPVARSRVIPDCR